MSGSNSFDSCKFKLINEDFLISVQDATIRACSLMYHCAAHENLNVLKYFAQSDEVHASFQYEVEKWLLLRKNISKLVLTLSLKQWARS